MLTGAFSDWKCVSKQKHAEQRQCRRFVDIHITEIKREVIFLTRSGPLQFQTEDQ